MLLPEESKKVITKIDTDIAIEIKTKYPETTRKEREKIKLKYKNVERKLEVKRNEKWEKFRSPESNLKKKKKTHITSLLPELSIKIPSQSVNQNSLKDTPPFIKRSFVDVLVNGNKAENDGANETKAVEETKIDERNITDNRAMWNDNKVKREQKKNGNLEKIDLKKI